MIHCSIREIIPPSPPSLPPPPFPRTRISVYMLMHRPTATTRRSYEIKDDAEGMASPSDTQNKDRRTVEQGGRRPVPGGGRGGEGSEGNESKERGLRSETIVLFHCGGSETRSPSAVIDAPKTKGLPLDKKNNVASLLC